jgi:hypothetical protein
MKTRRQATAAATPTPKADQNPLLMNGNGSAHGVVPTKDYPHENIFIFIPNLIGEIR